MIILSRFLSARGRTADMKRINYYNASGQMNLTDRIAIEVGLGRGESFKKIGERIRRHPSTIAHLMITNSNHPRLHELYKRFDIKVVQVRRAVNCKGNGRKGEDTIITAFH